MTVKIIFLNGPPGSGKDFAAYLLKKNRHFQADIFKFADYLKVLTHHVFGLDVFNANAPDSFEKVKDQERVEFEYMTPRQAYIMVSETMMKPKFGDTIFGNRLVQKLREDLPHGFGTQYVAIADSGFISEAIPVVAEFGHSNCIHIRLARTGYSFINDSRSYWDAKSLNLRSRDVQNVGIPEPFEKALIEALKGF